MQYLITTAAFSLSKRSSAIPSGFSTASSALLLTFFAEPSERFCSRTPSRECFKTVFSVAFSSFPATLIPPFCDLFALRTGYVKNFEKHIDKSLCVVYNIENHQCEVSK